jgi:hypothetical protein
MFFHFPQNNSGGSFVFNEEAGITHHVFIEAQSADEALRQAEEIGIYFNGIESGRDCDCCGDRWYSITLDDEGNTEPLLYGNSVLSEGVKDISAWMKPGYEICVHFADGTKRWV